MRSTTRLVPLAGIGYTRSLKLLPCVTSSNPGSMRPRITSSNTTCPIALSTGTASRMVPFTSIAKLVTLCPSSNGNCNSPSRMRAFGLKNVISNSVNARRPLTSPRIRTDCNCTGRSVRSGITRRGGIQICGRGTRACEAKTKQAATIATAKETARDVNMFTMLSTDVRGIHR